MRVQEFAHRGTYTGQVDFRQSLQQDGFNVTQQRFRLGSGTSMVTSAELGFEINYGDPVYNGLLDL